MLSIQLQTISILQQSSRSIQTKHVTKQWLLHRILHGFSTGCVFEDNQALFLGTLGPQFFWVDSCWGYIIRSRSDDCFNLTTFVQMVVSWNRGPLIGFSVVCYWGTPISRNPKSSWYPHAQNHPNQLPNKATKRKGGQATNLLPRWQVTPNLEMLTHILKGNAITAMWIHQLFCLTYHADPLTHPPCVGQISVKSPLLVGLLNLRSSPNCHHFFSRPKNLRMAPRIHFLELSYPI